MDVDGRMLTVLVISRLALASHGIEFTTIH